MNSNKAYQVKLDEFLDEYSAYKINPTEERKHQLLVLAAELSLMNSKFRFEEIKG